MRGAVPSSWGITSAPTSAARTHARAHCSSPGTMALAVCRCPHARAALDLVVGARLTLPLGAAPQAISAAGPLTRCGVDRGCLKRANTPDSSGGEIVIVDQSAENVAPRDSSRFARAAEAQPCRLVLRDTLMHR